MNTEDIIKQAEKELEEEKRREEIERIKENLRKKKWYHKLFPYKIRLIRR